MRTSILIISLVALLSTCASGGPAYSQSPELEALKKEVLRHYSQFEYEQALPLVQKGLAIAKEKSSPEVQGDWLNKLANVHWHLRRYREAEEILLRAQTAYKSALQPGHYKLGRTLNGLGQLAAAQDDFVGAKEKFEGAIAIYDAILKNTPNRGRARDQALSRLARVLHNLGVTRAELGRHGEAEEYLKRAYDTYAEASVWNKSRVETAIQLSALSPRSEENYIFLRRMIPITRELNEIERQLDHADARNSASLKKLSADLLIQRGDIQARRAWARLPESRSDDSLKDWVLRYAKRAERDYLDARKALIDVFKAKNHPDIATVENNLAELYARFSRFKDAEPLFRSALKTRLEKLPRNHIDTGLSQVNVARIDFIRKNWEAAMSGFWKGTQIVAKASRRGNERIGEALIGTSTLEPQRNRQAFAFYIKAADRASGRDSDEALLNNTFLAAQSFRTTTAAKSMARMVARHISGDSKLAIALRKRQELVTKWELANQSLREALDEPGGLRRPHTQLRERLKDIDSGIAALDEELRGLAPQYAAVAQPGAAEIEDVKTLLRNDEALILTLVTPGWMSIPEETFVWVVTKDDSKWIRSELGANALRDHVDALRCGLDYNGWKGSRCRSLLKVTYTNEDREMGRLLPYDPFRAHTLYKSLFGKLEDELRGKKLLIVPSGPLEQLPFHVLVTDPPPASGELSDVAWLAKRHSISVLPAVSSLNALRAQAGASKAKKEFVGYGNPLLSGLENKPSHVKAAKLAREIKGCADAVRLRTAALRGTDRLRGVSIPKFGSHRLVFPGEVRRMAPLPESADELCEIARSTGADLDRDIHLGADLTEPRLKQLSKSGGLNDYKVVSFSTHGAMAGELFKGKEPGLIMTPPTTATNEDDGYLSASEIMELKLDADWVILSACNTAAGGEASAEALSGLARAFFYAGARSLLVSYWSVYSKASVELITTAFERLKSDPRMGRSEALRVAMIAVMKQGGGKAHPAYWAPFVVVGEGAAQVH